MELLKEILSSKPVLKFFDPTQRVTLQVDASKLGQGAGILQDEYPIVYASRLLTPAEENYSQIKKELLTVVFGCERFNHYVYGRPVELESDHETLAPITKKPVVHSPAMLQRLCLRLQKYDISITYVAGKYMHVADTLTHRMGSLPILNWMMIWKYGSQTCCKSNHDRREARTNEVWDSSRWNPSRTTQGCQEGLALSRKLSTLVNNSVLAFAWWSPWNWRFIVARREAYNSTRGEARCVELHSWESPGYGEMQVKSQGCLPKKPSSPAAKKMRPHLWLQDQPMMNKLHMLLPLPQLMLQASFC